MSRKFFNILWMARVDTAVKMKKKQKRMANNTKPAAVGPFLLLDFFARYLIFPSDGSQMHKMKFYPLRFYDWLCND